MSSSIDAVLAQFDAHSDTHRICREQLADEIAESADVLVSCLENGGKILAFGNGGSAAQADHLAAELTGRFKFTRRPLPALSLASSGALVTCIANDFGFGELFARQVEAHGREGDVAVGLTTSGASENVLRGLAEARRKGLHAIALTGGTGLTSSPADTQIIVPSTSTARIQEVHLLIIHIWCEVIDRRFVRTEKGP